MKYVGLFFIVLAIGLLINKKKADKGKETWETKHNIRIKTWWIIVSFVFGLIFTFGSNFYANITITENGAEKEIANWTSGQNTEENSEIEKSEDAQTEKSSENNLLIMQDGFEVTINYNGEIINTDNLALSITDGEQYAMYTDSFVKVNDTNAITELFNEYGFNTDEIYLYSTESESTIYASLREDSGFRKVLVLQEIGSTNYLAIEITDYSNSLDLENLVSKFALNL